MSPAKIKLDAADSAATTNEPSFRRTHSAKVTTLFLHEMNSVLDTKLDHPRDVETAGLRKFPSARRKNFSDPDGVAVVSMRDG